MHLLNFRLTLVRLLAIFTGQIDPRTCNLEFFDLTTVKIIWNYSVYRDCDFNLKLNE